MHTRSHTRSHTRTATHVHTNAHTHTQLCLLGVLKSTTHSKMLKWVLAENVKVREGRESARVCVRVHKPCTSYKINYLPKLEFTSWAIFNDPPLVINTCWSLATMTMAFLDGLERRRGLLIIQKSTCPAPKWYSQFFNYWLTTTKTQIRRLQ